MQKIRQNDIIAQSQIFVRRYILKNTTTICIFSLAVLAGVAANFILDTPPIKTGGLSYIQKSHIQNAYEAAYKSEAKIDPALTEDGILKAEFQSADGKELSYQTDALHRREPGQNLMISAGLTKDSSTEPYATLNTMVFVTNTPTMVLTLTGELPFKIAGILEPKNFKDSKLGDHFNLISENHASGERQLTLELHHDMSMDRFIQLLSDDEDLGRLTNLNQSYLKETGKLEIIQKEISSPAPASSDRDVLVSGSQVQVFIKSDTGTVDRGINIVYRPRPNAA